MSEYVITVIQGGKQTQIEASSRVSILDNLREADIVGVEAPCGGAGTCRKCQVIVTGYIRSLESGTVRRVTDLSVLACRFAPESSLNVVLSDSSQMRVVTKGSGKLSAGGKGLGFSVDIGTTTVAAFLYDLETGELLRSAGERNAQRAFGADVISRITACTNGKLPALRDAIRAEITALGIRLAAEAGKRASDIEKISIAGNTVMQHLFADLNPEAIGVAPFTPESLFDDTRNAKDILPGLGADCEVYLCPCVSGYVGGDITAGLMATDGDFCTGLRLYIDIGTNGEMGLGNREGFVTCATAAGPAFEGAEISCGMGGLPGAIDRVWVEDGDLKVHVIGGGKAVGICGSGLVDAVAALLSLGILQESGRMSDADELPGNLSGRIFKGPDGHNACMLRDEVYISAQDLREIQLAKAAIRAGAETLLKLAGKKASDITELVIAGGFGSFLKKDSALSIGLLPEVAPEKISHAGNAAGAGASLCLTDAGLRRIRELNKKCSYLELSGSPDFMEYYVDYMAFY